MSPKSGPRGAKTGLRRAQAARRAAKSAPRRPQEPPGEPQERAREGPAGDLEPQEPPGPPKWLPKSPPEAQNPCPRDHQPQEMLFEIACRNFFRDHSRPDARNAKGSVAGFGGACPTGDPATEPLGSTGAVERSAVYSKERQAFENPQRYRR